jgi:hypothetical protein
MRAKVRGAIIHTAGSKVPTPVYKLYQTPLKTTSRVLCIYLVQSLPDGLLQYIESVTVGESPANLIKLDILYDHYFTLSKVMQAKGRAGSRI